MHPAARLDMHRAVPACWHRSAPGYMLQPGLIPSALRHTHRPPETTALPRQRRSMGSIARTCRGERPSIVTQIGSCSCDPCVTAPGVLSCS